MYINHTQHWASPELTEVTELKICWQRSQALPWYHASMHAVCETMLGCSAKNLQEKWTEKASWIFHMMTDWMHLDAKSKASFLHMFLHTNRGKKIGEVVFLQYNDAWWLILPSSCPTFASRTLRFPPYLICKANTSACCHQEPRAAEVICLFQAWSFRSPWISWIGRLSSANWVDDLFLTVSICEAFSMIMKLTVGHTVPPIMMGPTIKGKKQTK